MMPSMVHIIGVVSSISPLLLVDAAISIVKAARNSQIQTGKLLHANAIPVRAFGGCSSAVDKHWEWVAGSGQQSVA